MRIGTTELTNQPWKFEGEPIAISSVFGRMRRCTDIAPVRTLQAVKWLTGQAFEDVLSAGQVTYAEVAHIMRALSVARLKTAAA